MTNKIKKLVFRFLLLIGVLNAITIFVGGLTGTNAYVIAENLKNYFELLLCIIPLSLTLIALIWWLSDIFLKTEQRVNYLAIAFCGILADAVFLVGSILFATGH